MNLPINIFPNPFSQSARITLDLNFDSNVLIEIYTAQMEKVLMLMKDIVYQGYNEISFNASDKFSSGIYFVKIIIINEKESLVKLLKASLIK